jgi:hypothetical protein
MANVPPALAAVPHATFRAYYNSKDEYNRNYALLMNSFVIPGQGPAVLRDLATNNPQESSIVYMQLCLQANNPAGPGIVHTVHNVTRCRASL